MENFSPTFKEVLAGLGSELPADTSIEQTQPEQAVQQHPNLDASAQNLYKSFLRNLIISASVHGGIHVVDKYITDDALSLTQQSVVGIVATVITSQATLAIGLKRHTRNASN